VRPSPPFHTGWLHWVACSRNSHPGPCHLHPDSPASPSHRLRLALHLLWVRTIQWHRSGRNSNRCWSVYPEVSGHCKTECSPPHPLQNRLQLSVQKPEHVIKVNVLELRNELQWKGELFRRSWLSWGTPCRCWRTSTGSTKSQPTFLGLPGPPRAGIHQHPWASKTDLRVVRLAWKAAPHRQFYQPSLLWTWNFGRTPLLVNELMLVYVVT
jgi:hypothetical protein